jgi:hypothetical protein
MTVDTKGTPEDPPAFFQFNPALRRGQGGRHWIVLFTKCIVKPMEAHHFDQPNTAGGAHSGSGEEHAASFIGGSQGPGLGVRDGDEVFAISLLGISACIASGRVSMKLTDLQLIGLEILARTLVKDVVIEAVFLMAICRHRPHSVLETHRRAHMGGRVEGSQVVALVYDGDEMLLLHEEDLVAASSSAIVKDMDTNDRDLQIFDDLNWW